MSDRDGGDTSDACSACAPLFQEHCQRQNPTELSRGGLYAIGERILAGNTRVSV